jgi:RimJ/RimL family protein N-acetyltransferase
MQTASSLTTTFHEVPVINAKTGIHYQMVPASRVDSTDEQLSNLVSICNQPLIYEFLFKERLSGVAYNLDNARSFLEWAKDGWQNRSHFVFFLVGGGGLIVGALDIKSNDRAGAEIGYWCSQEHPGLMTNAVAELAKFARSNRFTSLWARVRSDNEGSKRVLEKNGFQYTGGHPDGPLSSRYDLRF